MNLRPLKQKEPPPLNRTAKSLAAWTQAALDDLIRVERAKQYSVYMNAYVTTEEDEDKCGVCFAGSLMMGRFYNKIQSVIAEEHITLNHIIPCRISKNGKNNSDLELMFISLDAIGRKGVLVYTVETWTNNGLPYNSHAALEKLERQHIPYEVDRGEFKRWCRRVIRTLQEL